MLVDKTIAVGKHCFSRFVKASYVTPPRMDRINGLIS